MLETGGKKCEIFYTAYTLDGKNTKERPITFAFNGGPGSASMFLHIGCLGPRRIDVDENGRSKELPAKLSDNPNSLLDLTDLVIIDAVGTGYSRSLEDSPDPFIGYDSDARTMGDFVRQYISRKYVAGESYGTTRAVAVCSYLADACSLNLNGLILISAINDFSTIHFSESNDVPYAAAIPTFAADAWFHGVLDPKYQDLELEEYLAEVKTFVEKEYVPALFQGSRMSEADRKMIASILAGYTGLSEEMILSRNLRVTLDEFLTGLMKDRKLTVGRLDGRIAGPYTGESIGTGEDDPSSREFNLMFGNAMNDCIINELNFKTDRPYIPQNQEELAAWTFPGSAGDGYLSQESVIRTCISKNTYLKVWVLGGYYDGATQFYANEWTFGRVFLSEERKENVTFSYYPCGHMICLEKESLDLFRRDAEAWFQ